MAKFQEETAVETPADSVPDTVEDPTGENPEGEIRCPIPGCDVQVALSKWNEHAHA